MSEPIQIIPSLTLLEDGGEFTLRVGEAKWAGELGRSIVSLIGGMGIARKLTILTPGDTKVFKFGPGDRQATAPAETGEVKLPATPQATLRPSQRISQDTAAPPAPELVGEYEAELARQSAAEAEVVAAERLARMDAGLEPAEAEVVEMPRKRGRPSKVSDSLKAATACGRCAGAGTLEGGGSCPVCRGVGSISHYGRGR